MPDELRLSKEDAKLLVQAIQQVEAEESADEDTVEDEA